MNDLLHPRLAATALARHLRAVPVTVLSGARQTGKSTLARSEGGSRRTVIDLDGKPQIAYDVSELRDVTPTRE